MNKIELTSKEFLSIYTGVVLTKNFGEVISAMEKLEGEEISTYATIIISKIFRNFIRETEPKIARAVKNIGRFVPDKNEELDKQINNYVDKFEKEIGSNTVEIDLNNYRNYNYSMEF